MCIRDRRVDKGWLVVERPLADGGEGTVEVLVQGTGGKIIEKEVSGPRGEKVKAYIGVVSCSCGEVAVLEMAQVAGLTLLPPEERNPRFTTTYGVGELIKEAVNLGFRRIVLGVGGSATNDGGMGALRALGVRFFDREGKEPVSYTHLDVYKRQGSSRYGNIRTTERQTPAYAGRKGLF